MLSAFLPSNLDLDRFLKDNPPTFKYVPDKFRYIISLITEIPAFNKDLLDQYTYVPISAKLLQERVHDYRQYLDYLVDHHIFETDNHYVVDQECKGYRFTLQYRKSIKVEQITRYTLVKNITNRTGTDSTVAKKYAYLHRWFDDKLTIDDDEAFAYLCDQLKKNREAGIENALLKFNASLVSTYKLKEHDYLFTVDDNVGRLHTNLTTIKSELRNFITYDGQPMVSVDYRNSQPCLSAALLDERFYTMALPDQSKGKNLLSIYDISQPTDNFLPFTSPSSISDTLSYIMLVKSGETHNGAGFQPYISHVSSGTLYPYIQQKFKEQTGTIIVDKRELKAVVFTVLFTDNRFIGQPEAEPKRIFRDLFPDVYKVFSMIKKGDKSILPRLLQTIESKLMLDRVAKRISLEHPDMTIYTIHDSIACVVGNEHYVARVMKEEMQKAIGVTPSVSFDYWKPENAYKRASIEGEDTKPLSRPISSSGGL